MITPLYKEYELLANKPEQAHTGLWFDRFFNRYDSSWSLANEDKQGWIKQAIKSKIGSTDKLETFIKRQIALVSQLKGSSQCYKCEWHFVTGMGNSHPVENGFSWHPTLAVPYLSGASVKGLVRAWVEMNDEELSDEANKARLKSWFGTEDKETVADQTGDFLFFDALPDKSPLLACDIMTPHMGDWYSKGDEKVHNAKNIPADWHEPVPVPFLVVKEAEFVFHIAPRRGIDTDELDLVVSALTSALKWLGAGAKTSAGYGYMSEDTQFSEDRNTAINKAVEEQREAEENSLLSEQQQAIKAIAKVFAQKQAQNINETTGGDLYRDLKTLISVAIEQNWDLQDKQSIQVLAREMVIYMGAKPNKGKPRDLINSLN